MRVSLLALHGVDWHAVSSPPTPHEASDTGRRVGFLLRLAHRKSALSFSDALRPLGIEGKHFGVLHQLAHAGPLSQRQLIDRLLGDKSSMVRTVDDLEKRGLAVRRPAAGDRRAHAVELTDEGRRVCAAAEQTARTAAETLLADFGPRDRAQFEELLLRLIGDDLPDPLD